MHDEPAQAPGRHGCVDNFVYASAGSGASLVQEPRTEAKAGGADSGHRIMAADLAQIRSDMSELHRTLEEDAKGWVAQAVGAHMATHLPSAGGGWKGQLAVDCSTELAELRVEVRALAAAVKARADLMREELIASLQEQLQDVVAEVKDLREEMRMAKHSVAAEVKVNIPVADEGTIIDGTEKENGTEVTQPHCGEGPRDSENGTEVTQPHSGEGPRDSHDDLKANSPGVEEDQPAPAPVSTCAGCVGQACAGPSLGRTCALGHQLEWAELSPLDTGEAEADVWACETCLGTLPAEHSEDAIIVDSHGWMCSECEIAFCQRCMPQAAGLLPTGTTKSKKRRRKQKLKSESALGSA